MLLCIDVGNTNIVMGVLDKDKIIGHWRVRTEKDATSDELGILICNLFQTSKINMDEVKDIIISCVVPPLLNALEGLSKRYFNIKPMVVGRYSAANDKLVIPILICEIPDLPDDAIEISVLAHFVQAVK